MKHRTLVLTALLVSAIFFSRSAPAQDDAAKPKKARAASHAKIATPEDRLDNRLKLAKTHLGLTDPQVDQLRSVLGQNQDKLQADKKKFLAADSGSKERKVARKQLMTDRKAMLDQLKGVLSEEQLAKFKKMKLAKIEDEDERVGRSGESKKKTAKTK